jgi:hypothetical protein
VTRHRERSELQRLDDTERDQQQRKRLIRSEPVDRAPASGRLHLH